MLRLSPSISRTLTRSSLSNILPSGSSNNLPSGLYISLGLPSRKAWPPVKTFFLRNDRLYNVGLLRGDRWRNTSTSGLQVVARGAKSLTNSQRPSLDDVEKLSKGRPSKAKMGSRRVPHRLNADERKAFELAKRRRYLVVKPNSRRYPVVNTFRNYCDAVGWPNIRIEQGSGGEDDTLVVDLTTLRLEAPSLEALQAQVAELAVRVLQPGGHQEASGEGREGEAGRHQEAEVEGVRAGKQAPGRPQASRADASWHGEEGSGGSSLLPTGGEEVEASAQGGLTTSLPTGLKGGVHSPSGEGASFETRGPSSGLSAIKRGGEGGPAELTELNQSSIGTVPLGRGGEPAEGSSRRRDEGVADEGVTSAVDLLGGLGEGEAPTRGDPGVMFFGSRRNEAKQLAQALIEACTAERLMR